MTIQDRSADRDAAGRRAEVRWGGSANIFSTQGSRARPRSTQNGFKGKGTPVFAVRAS